MSGHIRDDQHPGWHDVERSPALRSLTSVSSATLLGGIVLFLLLMFVFRVAPAALYWYVLAWILVGICVAGYRYIVVQRHNKSRNDSFSAQVQDYEKHGSTPQTTRRGAQTAYESEVLRIKAEEDAKEKKGAEEAAGSVVNSPVSEHKPQKSLRDDYARAKKLEEQERAAAGDD